MQRIYAIHDITAEIYTAPFYAVNNATASRIFANAVRTPGTSIYDNPEDFRLYCIGVYDEQSADLIPHQSLEFIARASDFTVNLQTEVTE